MVRAPFFWLDPRENAPGPGSWTKNCSAAGEGVPVRQRSYGASVAADQVTSLGGILVGCKFPWRFSGELLGAMLFPVPSDDGRGAPPSSILEGFGAVRGRNVSFRFDDFEIDLGRHELRRAGQAV